MASQHSSEIPSTQARNRPPFNYFDQNVHKLAERCEQNSVRRGMQSRRISGVYYRTPSHSRSRSPQPRQTERNRRNRSPKRAGRVLCHGKAKTIISQNKDLKHKNNTDIENSTFLKNMEKKAFPIPTLPETLSAEAFLNSTSTRLK